MSGVVPAWHLIDLLSTDKLKEQRKAVKNAFLSFAKEGAALSPSLDQPTTTCTIEPKPDALLQSAERGSASERGSATRTSIRAACLARAG